MTDPAKYLGPWVTSQKQLAERMGLSEQYVSDLLNGRRRMSPSIVERFSDALEFGDIRRRELHRLGARAQGWKV